MGERPTEKKRKKKKKLILWIYRNWNWNWRVKVEEKLHQVEESQARFGTTCRGKFVEWIYIFSYRIHGFDW